MAEVLPIRDRRDSHRRAAEPAAAPSHLSDRSREIWRAVLAEWVIGAEALPILRAGLECLDLFDKAREQLAREGLTVVNPDTGLQRTHPAASVLKDSLSGFRACFRQLNLTPPEEV
jgi:phage terminase small subunit